MTTLFAAISYGNEPYILAASIGTGLGEVVIPEIYPGEREILRRWVGDDPRIYLDPVSGIILSRVHFRDDYKNYIQRVLTDGKSVEDDLSHHLRDFEAVSLTGERKRFRDPEIELNIGLPISTHRRRSFYVFPGLISEYAQKSPVDTAGEESFIKCAQEIERSHRLIFIPEVNAFSYLGRGPGEREVYTPPLKRRGKHSEQIDEGIFLTLPGSRVLADDLSRAAKKANMHIYHLPENEGGLPGTTVENHEIIFNPNIKVVLARAGWGTLWLCQVAEKPIMTPIWKQNDDPEIGHNNQTIKKLGLGVVYEEFSDTTIREALTKVDKIKELNGRLLEKFGTLDGIGFVQERIRSSL